VRREGCLDAVTAPHVPETFRIFWKPWVTRGADRARHRRNSARLATPGHSGIPRCEPSDGGSVPPASTSKIVGLCLGCSAKSRSESRSACGGSFLRQRLIRCQDPDGTEGSLSRSIECPRSSGFEPAGPPFESGRARSEVHGVSHGASPSSTPHCAGTVRELRRRRRRTG
jgi:hypothetical protein